MDRTAFLKTICFCAISIIIELFSYSKSGKTWFENLRQPKYSFPFSVWYIVGGLYYIIFGVIAYRQFYHAAQLFTLPIILLALTMLLNGLPNFILFKFRSLNGFNWTFLPFIIVFAALIITLFNTDQFSAWLACIYLVWLCYDVYYFAGLMKLNKSGSVSGP